MAPLRIGYWPRRLLRNAGIVGLALVVYVVVVNVTSYSSQVLFRLSMATGYTSVVLIGWALLIGPWRVMRGRSAPVSTDLRRDVGIWGGLFGLAHVATGLFVHLGDPLKYFFFRDETRRAPVRYDLFGFANWTGLAATLLLLLLLVISNDISLRRLGSRRWKAWQRWTYWAGALIVAHGLAYQWIEKGNGGWVYLFVPVVLIVAGLQLDGRRRFLARRAQLSDAQTGD
ncbi:MAG: ferric reductase-like transmembrane domain-containing protein [Gemmatimonadetes bacterium]|nr:ferric reductase-like transmembrane domain-containing protein [Gemmatimonadota bacterium]